MRIARYFTQEDVSPYHSFEFRKTYSEIKNPDGSVVFRADDIEVPGHWSQVACDILAQKYFRKAGVPACLKPVEEDGVPQWLWRRAADAQALPKLSADERYTGESSVPQVLDRLAGTWTYWGWKGGTFDSEADARAYFDEMRHMLCAQAAAPNSPQWFNTGLHWAYGIDGPAQGHTLRRLPDRRAVATRRRRLRAPPAPRLLHPGHRRRPGQRRRHHGPVGARGTAVQVRLGHGHNFSRLRAENEPLSGGGSPPA